MLFRAFTGLLFPLVANSTERYGDEGLAGVVLCTSIIMTVGVLFNGFRYIRYIPTCVLEGIKNGTGYLIILTEIYSLTGVKQKHTSVTLYHFLWDFFTKFERVHYGELLLGIGIGFAGYKLHKRYKQVPWPFFIFGVGVIFGTFSYSADNHNRLALLKDLAPLEFKRHGLLEGINLNFFSAGLRGLLIPGVYMYSLAVVMLTLFEVCISISLDEDTFGKKIKRKREFLSLSLANYVSWAFGWFPLSNPVGRIQFALNCGANHRIFHFMNVGLMLFLYLFCFELTGYMPICLMKATNIMISLNLVEPWVLRTYAHYSPKTAAGMWAMILAMLLVDVAI